MNYWDNKHNEIQYLLDIHKNQGNKRKLFPFELAYQLCNDNNNEESLSYIITYYNLNNDEIKEFNIKKLEDCRESIHNKLQDLLNTHKNNEEFSTELKNMIGLNTNMNLLQENYNYNKLYFFDIEGSNFDIEYFNNYINYELEADKAPNEYILYKSLKYDKNYTYKRTYPKSYYNLDNYLPKKEQIINEIEEYEGINNDLEEPIYSKFFHFEEIF